MVGFLVPFALSPRQLRGSLCTFTTTKGTPRVEKTAYPLVAAKMRRLLAPLFLVAIMASFPASLLLIFIRGMVSTGVVGGRVRVDACAFATQYYGSCDGNMESYGLPSHGGVLSCSVDVGIGKRSTGSSLVTGLLFAHAITTHHDALPPSRYPMVVATAASTIVASTTTTTQTSHSPPSSSSSFSSGAKVRILRSVMAESSHGRSSSSNYKPRQARSIPGPSQQEPRSSLRQEQPELAAEVGGGNAAAAAQESSSYSPSSSATHQQHIPHVAETPSDTLKITVLGPLREESHSCSYSLVEFTNTVSSDYACESTQ